MQSSEVNHPKHYNSHPSNIECIEIKRYLPSSLADAFKYIWRCSLKKNKEQDLDKAIWYLNDFKEYPVHFRSVDDCLSDIIPEILCSTQSDAIAKIFKHIYLLSLDKGYLPLVDIIISDIQYLKLKQ